MLDSMIITEDKLSELIVSAINEAYNKWFQAEENTLKQVRRMIREIKGRLGSLFQTKPDKVWETIRLLAFVNHSAYKVIPGMWDKFPEEKLHWKDFKLNMVIYDFKHEALEQLVDYYLQHGLDVSMDENRNVVAFREPTTGVRQITFHVKKDSQIYDKIEKISKWDGVKQAHHFTNDDDYKKQLNPQITQ